MSAQRENLERVSAQIEGYILEFAAAVPLRGHCQFHVEELRQYVADRVKVAPASADRILRALRQQGRLNYRVVNRRASLYELTAPEAA